MISREEAIEMIHENIDTENLKNHMFAVAQIMKRLAEELDEDEEKWELLGLVHDLDYEQTKDDPEKHALKSAEMVEGKVPEDILRAIKAHNHEHTGVEPKNDMEYAIHAADAVSGLIVATALVMPNSKLEEARPESVEKKFDDSSFAKNIDRDRILYYEKLGLERDEFLELSLKALQEIDEKLGL
ncbi:MAG: HD domain-containing protein [Candidatus Thermoplasmatota archaeon]|nr:HD domain-containing protein [Candidatus Thermoplasmatota archaeon]